MKRHLQHWGAAYILAVFFLGSWFGQYLMGWDAFAQEQASHGEPATRADYLAHFWQATFENWQSEWFQLFVQAVLLLGLGHYVFKADKADMEDVQRRLERIERRLNDR